MRAILGRLLGVSLFIAASSAVGVLAAESAQRRPRSAVRTARSADRGQRVAAGRRAGALGCEADFAGLLQRLGKSGAVDERSVRLFQVLPDGGQREQPVQLLAREQPRAAQRQFLPATVSGVSYLAEVAASEAQPVVPTGGQLSWIAQGDSEGRAHYRLQFGVLRRGRAIQVPYPPQNWRMFDDQDRATPLAYFPRMQIRPQWPLDGVLHIADNGVPVTSYHLGPLLEAPPGSPDRRRSAVRSSIPSTDRTACR